LSKEPIFWYVWQDDMQLKQKGVIPWDQLKKGIELSLENAARLKNDADLLFANRRVGSAVALWVAAWEEIGKAVLLLKHWKLRQDIKGHSWRRIFREHSPKQSACFENRDLLWGKNGDEYRSEEMEKLRVSLRYTKEVLGLYVNWVEEKKTWFSPSDRVGEMWTRYLSYSVNEFLAAIPQTVSTILAESDRN
jgi:AbiV family abortive infection protein